MIPTRRSPRLHPKSQPNIRYSASSKATKENKPSSRKIRPAKESYGRDHKRDMDRISLPPGDSQSLGVLDSTEKFERLHPYRAENSGCSEFSSNHRRRSRCPSPESEQFRPSLKRIAAVLRKPKARARKRTRYRFDWRQLIMKVSDPRGNRLNGEVMCVDLLPLFE
ncbi:hypothetical protein L207DRAFT_511857 [Hyaloscypha variabilis F]|uniref:Uncharacterized protein n=1 Tax=Hyaloscypha variabilis (strain UAMH 11265 / GT02V1 / F) TaxID=1149755 RepID=A0A2J6RPC3_HYAVF|nr:hypothetical protein L207DRAFT_511857 [Hyaloscypha variabilis F]